MQKINPDLYADQLAEKQRYIEKLFASFTLPPLEIFDSPPLHFRMRAEFRIWHQADKCFYAMTPPGERTPRPIDDFPIGSTAMIDVMAPLLDSVNNNPLLRRKLYGCEFLTTQCGEVLVTLIYHRPLDDAWREAAEQLSKQLGIGIIGRSKKQKMVIDKDFVTESLVVNGKRYRYQQIETGFTQPNAPVNEKMLGWAKSVTAASPGDLLELYCGNGNFTVVLSENFRNVLATEVSKISVQSALVNFQNNAVKNTVVVRMSSEELTQALNRVREFNRLRGVDLNDYDFSTIFVDPPRAGLDAATLELAQNFRKILYISCNALTLKENIEYLNRTHEIKRFALFDQFPYTNHIECGVMLGLRNES